MPLSACRNYIMVFRFLLFFLLIGCEGSIKEKAKKNSIFNAVNTEREYGSKSSIHKWETILEIVSSNYSNQDQVDAFLVKNSPSLFSKHKNVPKNILKDINKELYGVHVTESALLFANFTMKNFNSIQDCHLHSYAAATLSNHYQDLMMFDSVKKYNLYLKKSLESNASDEPMTVIYHTNNANLLKNQGFLFESVVNYHKALDLIDQNDKLTKFTLITNIAGVYIELNYPDKAKIFIDSAKSFIPIKEWSIESLNLAGVIYSKTNDFSESKLYYLLAIKNAAATNNPISLAQTYSNYANLNRKVKKYTTALKYMQMSDSICRDLGMDYGILINRINRAELYLDIKSYEKGLFELDQVKKELNDYDSPELQIEYFEIAYRLNDAIGNTDVANSMYRVYKEKKYQYLGDLPRSVIAEWELATENEKIVKDRADFALKAEQQSNEKYYIILISILLLLAIGLLSLIRNRKNILDREKGNQEKQKIAFDLELKSKQLVSESLKNISIQNTKEDLLNQLEVIIQDLPKIHQARFEQIKHTLKRLKPSSMLDEFETRFTGIYDDYYDKLKIVAPELTPNELRICALMRLNISTKEIAMLTNRTIGTVDNTRSAIRKKLKLEEETNLQEFLLNI
jgi:DNA-binding CsgD family transcriptional regulator